MMDPVLLCINFIFLYRHEIDKVVREKYNMSNILENDIDGIVSRISFIQHREPSIMYIP